MLTHNIKFCIIVYVVGTKAVPKTKKSVSDRDIIK